MDWIKLKLQYFIKNATTTVALRDTPPWQWTSTLPPIDIVSYIEFVKFVKLLIIFLFSVSLELSIIGTCIYCLEINGTVRSTVSEQLTTKSYFPDWLLTIFPKNKFVIIEFYCNFYNGRRISDDLRQIKRWIAIAGPDGRFRKNHWKF